jgi:hypothetical protein
MTIRATQPISSRFGTYMPGQEIGEAAAVVIDGWIAAGIAERTEEEPEMAEKPQPAAPVERATPPTPEKAVGLRQRETPHRRFAADDKPTPQRRFEQDGGL